MNVRIIGDVHGRLDSYVKLTRECKYSIAMGEMGFGKDVTRLASMYVDDTINGENHIIIPGNHDHYGVIDDIPTFLTNPGWGPLSPHMPEGVFGNKKVFYVRGAISIDKAYRKLGINWFPEEELSECALLSALEFYRGYQPDIMITHTPPQNLVPQLIPPDGELFNFRTEHYLQEMLDIHRPKLWIFGHFHKTGVFPIPYYNTKFIGVGELATCDIDLDTMDIEVCPSLPLGWKDGYKVD